MFGDDDLTNVIANADLNLGGSFAQSITYQYLFTCPADQDVGDATFDADTTLDVDTTFDTADALTQAMEEVTAELKRKRGVRDEGESKRPSKILHTSQGSSSSATTLTTYASSAAVVDSPGPGGVRRTNTGSTAVASANTSQPEPGKSSTVSRDSSPHPSTGSSNGSRFGAYSSSSSSKTTSTPSTSLSSSTPDDEPVPPATLLSPPSRVSAREYTPPQPVVVVSALFSMQVAVG